MTGFRFTGEIWSAYRAEVGAFPMFIQYVELDSERKFQATTKYPKGHWKTEHGGVEMGKSAGTGPISQRGRRQLEVEIPRYRGHQGNHETSEGSINLHPDISQQPYSKPVEELSHSLSATQYGAPVPMARGQPERSLLGGNQLQERSLITGPGALLGKAWDSWDERTDSVPLFAAWHPWAVVLSIFVVKV
ncbi:hypothetical protein L218DRAFT_986684 [Marasmius fiardii PR-910]|nr:hypothetical protein L218DRAFT_986684 [Marasmius fiardii PR-910]